MNPLTRVDLFISYNRLETLSAGFTTRNLAIKTEEAVRVRANKQRQFPSIFFDNTTLLCNFAAIIDVILQTRPGGVALFLLTPEFFRNSSCEAELQAFLEVRAHSNVKLRFACLESTEDDILSISRLKTRDPTQSNFGLLTEIPVTTLEVTTALLCNFVFDAWECNDSDLSPQNLPTILGRSRGESFLALQQEFTKEDLPSFRVRLRLPFEVNDVQDAFIILGDRGSVTEHDVEELLGLITYRNAPGAERQRSMVEAYKRKWVLSSRLDWSDELRLKLFRLYENKAKSKTQGSSSREHQKRYRNPVSDVQDKSYYVTKRPRRATDLFE